MAENKISDMIAQALKSVREIIDVNTSIGDPIVTESGTTIIPVSKISVGLASGGLDYFSKNGQVKSDSVKPDSSAPKGYATKNAPLFGGGGGTGISVIPVGFLVVDKAGRVDLLNVANPTASGSAIDSVGNIVAQAPDIIDRFKTVFSKTDTPDTAEPLPPDGGNGSSDADAGA